MIARLLDLVRPHRAMAGQFVRFCAVGAFNTALDFSIYVALTRSFEFWGDRILLAATVSFSAGVTSSFLLNNFWTFRRDAAEWHRRSMKFLLVALGALWWNSLILHLLTSGFGVHDIIAKLVATGAVTMWNFTLHRHWTFRLK